MNIKEQLKNPVLIALSEKFKKIRPIFAGQPRWRDYYRMLKQYQKLHEKPLSKADLEYKLSTFNKNLYRYENNIPFMKR